MTATRIAISQGAVYELEDGGTARVHYVSSSCLLYERLDGRPHPYRIVRRTDGKLYAAFHAREAAVRAWDMWYQDGSYTA